MDVSGNRRVDKFFNPLALGKSKVKFKNNAERKAYIAGSIVFGVMTLGVGHGIYATYKACYSKGSSKIKPNLSEGKISTVINAEQSTEPQSTQPNSDPANPAAPTRAIPPVPSKSPVMPTDSTHTISPVQVIPQSSFPSTRAPTQQEELFQSLKASIKNDWNASELLRRMKTDPALQGEHLTAEMRISLYRCIAVAGYESACALAKECHTLSLDKTSLQDRLELYKLIAKQTRAEYPFGHFTIRSQPAISLTFNLNRLNLTGATLEQRLALYQEVGAITPDSACGVAKQLQKLGLEEATPEQLLELYKSLLQPGNSESNNPTKDLLLNINEQFVKHATQDQKLELCLNIARVEGLSMAGGMLAVEALLENIDKLELDISTPQDRLAFLRTIVSQGQAAASGVVFNLKEINIEEFSKEERFSLCQLIVAQGDQSALRVANKFSDFHLGDCTTPEERLSLCQLIVQQGDEAAQQVVYRLKSFDLDQIPIKERFQLYLSCAEQGLYSIMALLSCMNNLNFDLLDLSDRVRLYQLFAKHLPGILKNEAVRWHQTQIDDPMLVGAATLEQKRNSKNCLFIELRKVRIILRIMPNFVKVTFQDLQEGRCA